MQGHLCPNRSCVATPGRLCVNAPHAYSWALTAGLACRRRCGPDNEIAPPFFRDSQKREWTGKEWANSKRARGVDLAGARIFACAMRATDALYKRDGRFSFAQLF